MLQDKDVKFGTAKPRDAINKVLHKSTAGIKHDNDKHRVALVLSGFQNALKDCATDGNTYDNSLVENILSFYSTRDMQQLVCATKQCIDIFENSFDINKVHPVTFYGKYYNAIMSLCAVGTFGAKKYADNNWMGLQDGINRTLDASLRHVLAYMSGDINNHEEFIKDNIKHECNLPHLAHALWELLACIEFVRYERGLESTVTEAQNKLK